MRRRPHSRNVLRPSCRARGVFWLPAHTSRTPHGGTTSRPRTSRTAEYILSMYKRFPSQPHMLNRAESASVRKLAKTGRLSMCKVRKTSRSRRRHIGACETVRTRKWSIIASNRGATAVTAWCTLSARNLASRVADPASLRFSSPISYPPMPPRGARPLPRHRHPKQTLLRLQTPRTTPWKREPPAYVHSRHAPAQTHKKIQTNWGAQLWHFFTTKMHQIHL